MLWPFTRRAVSGLPATPGRRYATAGLVALIGVALSLAVWARAVGERQSELTGMLGSLADGSTSAIQWQMEREVDALRGLGTLWQIRGPQAGDAWQFDAGMVLDHAPGIQWVAWITRDSTQFRFMSRDTSARPAPEILAQARFQLTSPANAILDRWTDAYLLDLFLPVRSAQESLGIMVGEIRVDSLWLKRRPTLSGNLSITLHAENDHRLVLRSLPDSLAPEWMRMRRTITSPAGSSLRVSLAPSDDLVRQVATPWPDIFLLAGWILSIAIGALLLQFLRLRDFSRALGRTNLSLDAQLAELSKRDRDLRELNEALEQRVRARTTELSQALWEVETFSHSVSHDLRSPIGAILNYAAVLEEDFRGGLGPEGKRLLDRIRAAAGRANHLLDSLVEFAASGADSGQQRLIDMLDMAERAYAEAAGREGSQDEVRFSAQALPPAWGDPVLVHRVLVNLIGNALKYSRGRTPREVVVDGATDTTENTYRVRDNGCGFEPARAAELFEPFRRLHGSDVEGAGLGLAIVARSVSRMGGRVWAESDGSSGATFYFTLPRQERSHHDPSDGPAGG